VLLFGYPRGGDLTPRFGHVLVLNEPVTVNYGYGVYLTVESNTISTLTFPGNSGSAVFNSKGEVVNILYAGPNPLFLYGITVKNSQIHAAFRDMLSQ
jgi:S1-C subfamily serine protease